MINWDNALHIERDRLREALKNIENHPESWDQETWGRQIPNWNPVKWPNRAETIDLVERDEVVTTGAQSVHTACDTALCLAGWGAADSGRPMKWSLGACMLDEPGFESGEPFAFFEATLVAVQAESGLWQEPATFAERYFGLCNGTRRQLFHGRNSLETLREMITHLCDLPDGENDERVAAELYWIAERNNDRP